MFETYPVLKEGVDEAAKVGWQSAMTLKMVKAIETIDNIDPLTVYALLFGACIGVLMQLLREWLMFSDANDSERKIWSRNRTLDVVLDTVVCPLPYAFAAGTFISVLTCMWIAIGGLLQAVIQLGMSKRARVSQSHESIPVCSMLGGGLIAGEALSYMLLSLLGLLSSLR